MKRAIVLLVLALSIFATIPSYAGWTCWATNARGSGTWRGSWGPAGFFNPGQRFQAQRIALGFCRSAFRTYNPGTCHITYCTRY